MEPLAAAAAAFGLVFLSEFGDKSQVVVLAQAARQRPARVLAEALAAFALLTALAVTAGVALARVLPPWLPPLAAGVLFFAFGVAALREAKDDRDGNEPLAAPRGGTFVLVLASEMGDKTQLATAAFVAANGHALASGLGAFAGEAAATLLAVVAGAWLGRRVSRRARSWSSAVLFFAFGSVALAYGIRRLL